MLVYRGNFSVSLVLPPPQSLHAYIASITAVVAAKPVRHRLERLRELCRVQFSAALQQTYHTFSPGKFMEVEPRFAGLGTPSVPAVRFARGIKIGCPGECSAWLVEEIGAGSAYANTARPCFTDTPRGFALATRTRTRLPYM
ncbi:hypothetical protein GQ600_24303 [Phytophthora cactorum]|nr:hypothetical protein GQ600_24303 [Phytophthora cactorum]